MNNRLKLKNNLVKQSRLFACFLVIAVLFLSCELKRFQPERMSPDDFFPPSTSLLNEKGLESLKYSARRAQDYSLLPKKVISQVWTDAAFIEDAKAELRYRYEVRSLDSMSRVELRPFSVGLDVAFPVDSTGQRVLFAFISGLERLMKKNLSNVKDFLKRNDFQVNGDKTVTFSLPLTMQVTTNDIPRRGQFLSLDIYRDSSYIRIE